MSGIISVGKLHIPVFQDLDSFRHWTLSEEYPDEGEISYLGGLLWVDPSMEREAHNQIKTEFTIAVGGYVKTNQLGRFYSDRMRLVHPEAQLSTEPDAFFLSTQSLQRQRVQFQQGEDSLEAIGSPDMVLEVVSPTSVLKDTVHLVELYYRAGARVLAGQSAQGATRVQDIPSRRQKVHTSTFAERLDTFDIV